MTANQWERIEGMIVARELDPQEVAADLGSRGVLAQLEWFERSPQLLGICVAGGAEGVATVAAGGGEPVPGPTVADLAESLAAAFDADVRLGEAEADHLPAGASPLSEDDARAEAEEEDDLDAAGTSRIVEIGRTPASSVPLLAALEGVDLADMALGDGGRALLAVLPPERLGWNFGELPLVTLSMSHEEFQAFLVTDEHIEHVVTHNWAMLRVLVPGALGSAEALPADIADLVGDRSETDAIAAQVPGANADALYASTRLGGEEAVRAVVEALALPAATADFLLGRTPLEEVPGAEMHLARGISNAIGRSVDIMLKEPDSPSFPIWDAYHATAVDRPWIVRIGASVEAAVGATLLALAIRAESPRSGWTRLGGVLGGFLVVDSVAEVSLAKYLGLRAERRRRDRGDADR
ncbi:MAG: hypothetical protein LKI58_07610 [Actinomyces sp.]|jgi:hypothetical protein|nr:hypothetical protein [Actinomyces sp.]MCI1787917.1 hypothetical protein [Actinomyces sp.]MCI1830961.1 hypothetical protein [Actinomyces sp.]MCI1866322.1 hypothetical protein [Actinomyces sp.]